MAICIKSSSGKDLRDKYIMNDGRFKMHDQGHINGKTLYIHGRSDDVIIVNGRNITSGEIEAAVLQNDWVVECAAVGYDKDNGEKICVYCVVNSNIPKKDAKDIFKEVNVNLRGELGLHVRAAKIVIVKELPKTRSGKILRRILRIYAGSKDRVAEELQTIDISTAINPNCIKVLETSAIYES